MQEDSTHLKQRFLPHYILNLQTDNRSCECSSNSGKKKNHLNAYLMPPIKTVWLFNS